ncbi:MAG TPA: hypothetical protein VMG12_18870, partial [Polyangiaceae bacterium]|nr:hypothetical protein [Polyangiaceae bacterium]
PTLLGLAQPRDRAPSGNMSSPGSGGIAGATLVATGETGIAVGADIELGLDRVAAAASQGKGRQAWKSWGIGFGILLAGVTTAFGVVALTKGEHRDAFAVARQPLGIERVEPAKTVDISDPPLEVRRPVPPAPPAPLPPVPAVSNAAEPAALDGEPVLDAADDASDEAPARTRGARSSRSERSASSTRSSAARRSAAAKKAESKASRREAAASDAPPLPHPTRDACNPPWVVNAQQVKVFKAECLR